MIRCALIVLSEAIVAVNRGSKTHLSRAGVDSEGIRPADAHDHGILHNVRNEICLWLREGNLVSVPRLPGR